MAIIQVRDVPADVHDGLSRAAARRGLSLSEYLREELGRLARRSTLEEIQAEIATWPRSPQVDVAGALRDGR